MADICCPFCLQGVYRPKAGSLYRPALLMEDRNRQTFYNECMEKHEEKTESGRSRWMALTALVLVIAIVVVYVLSW